MTESFTKRARTAYYVAWLPMTALVAVALALKGTPWLWAAGLSLALGIPYALVCSSSYYMAKALPLTRRRLVQVLTSLVGASTAAGGLWAGAVYAGSSLIGGAVGAKLEGQTQMLFGIGSAYFALSLAFHYLTLALEQIHRAEREADEAQVLTREAELRALRAQVDPHFLFNSLNSIAALTTENPSQARKMCQLLSDFFRSTLRLGDLFGVDLRQEAALARKYLDIERTRFDDRMAVEEQIGEDCLEIQVPPLILQPLVENAVKHGVAQLDSNCTISLSVRRSDNRAIISIENDFISSETKKRRPGRGLDIVRSRLSSFYGPEAALMIEKEGSIFRVKLKVPVRGV